MQHPRSESCIKIGLGVFQNPCCKRKKVQRRSGGNVGLAPVSRVPWRLQGSPGDGEGAPAAPLRHGRVKAGVLWSSSSRG